MEQTADQLVNKCRHVLLNYGTADEFCSDEGPQFISAIFQNFLKTWSVHHRLASVEYPQSNERAELAVKTAKRIIRENVTANGSLETHTLAVALLQYRNTPIADVGLSPAQILFCRNLKDFLPAHPENYKLNSHWLKQAKLREQVCSQQYLKSAKRYNTFTHSLQTLQIGSRVVIFNKRQGRRGVWNLFGHIVECLGNRQYNVKQEGSGRVTLRNRVHLKLIPDSLKTPGRAHRLIRHSTSTLPISNPDCQNDEPLLTSDPTTTTNPLPLTETNASAPSTKIPLSQTVAKL